MQRVLTPPKLDLEERHLEESLPDYLSHDAHQRRVVVAGPINSNATEFKLFQALCNYLGQKESPYLMVRDFAEHVYKNTSLQGISNLENITNTIGSFVGKLASKAVDLAFVLKRDSRQSPTLVLLKTPGKLTQTEMLVRLNQVLLQQFKHPEAHKRFLSLERCAKKARLKVSDLKNDALWSFKLEEITLDKLEDCLHDDRILVVQYEPNFDVAFPSGRRKNPLEFWAHHLEKVHQQIEEEPFNYQSFRALVGSQRLNWPGLTKAFVDAAPHNNPTAMQFISLFNKVEQTYREEHPEEENDVHYDLIRMYYCLSAPMNAVLRHSQQTHLQRNTESRHLNDHFEMVVDHLLKATKSRSPSPYHSLYGPITLSELQSIRVSSPPIEGANAEAPNWDQEESPIETLGDLYDEGTLKSMLEPLMKSRQPIPNLISFVDNKIRYYVHRLRLISVVYSAIIIERERLMSLFFGQRGSSKKQVDPASLESFVNMNSSSLFRAVVNVAKLSITSKEDGSIVAPEKLMRLLFMRMDEAIRHKMRLSNLMVNEDGSPINKSQDLSVFVETLYDQSRGSFRSRGFYEILNLSPESVVEWQKQKMPHTLNSSAWRRVQELVDMVIRLLLDWLMALFGMSKAAKKTQPPEASQHPPKQFNQLHQSRKQVNGRSVAPAHGAQLNMESLLKLAPILGDAEALKKFLETSHDQWNNKIGYARSKLTHDVDEALAQITRRITLRELDEPAALGNLIDNIIQNNKALGSITNQTALKTYLRHKVLLAQKLLLERSPAQ